MTGEKINKLRKSYEGQLKKLGLEGRNKAGPNQDELFGLLDPAWDYPGQGGGTFWEQERVTGREINSQHTSDLFSKLDGALSMGPGQLPKEAHEKWKSALGLDDTSAAKATPSLAPSKNAAQYAMSKTNTSGMRASAPASPRNGLPRPGRPNKKRRYDDSAFEGYNDGFPDDDGYSTGGMDDRLGSASKKRRKVSAKHSGFHANP